MTEPESLPHYIAIDPAGNVVVAGIISNDGSMPMRDIVVLKYAPDGTELWCYRFDSGDEDYPLSMSLDPAGDIFVSGLSAISGVYQGLLLKLDAGGALHWMLRRGVQYKVLADAQGNVYSPSGMGLLKFDATGAFQWRHNITAASPCGQVGNDLALDPDGNIVVIGTSCFANPNESLSVSKFGPAGDLLLQREYPVTVGDAYGQHVTVDASGEIYVAGVQRLGSNGPTRLLTARVSSQGELRWLRTHIGDSGLGTYPSGIAIDPTGCVYLVSPAKLPGHNFLDYVTLRYDLDGRLLWRRTYDHGGGDNPSVMALDAQRRVYVSGHSASPGGQTGADFATLRYSPAPPPCPAGGDCYVGDANGDCHVDMADLTAVLANFGGTAGVFSPADGDLNFDGRINLFDLLQVLHVFGEDCR